MLAVLPELVVEESRQGASFCPYISQSTVANDCCPTKRADGETTIAYRYHIRNCNGFCTSTSAQQQHQNYDHYDEYNGPHADIHNTPQKSRRLNNIAPRHTSARGYAKLDEPEAEAPLILL